MAQFLRTKPLAGSAFCLPERGLRSDLTLRTLYLAQALAAVAVGPWYTLLLMYALGIFERRTCADARLHARTSAATALIMMTTASFLSALAVGTLMMAMRHLAEHASRRMWGRRQISIVSLPATPPASTEPFAPIVLPVASGVRTFTPEAFFEYESGQILPEVDFAVPEATKTAALVKRATDLLLLAVFAPIWLPLIALGAAAVWLSGGGSVFYTQQRVGLNGRIFTVYKLRTMRLHAEADGPQWAAGTADPRVTRVGRFLRRTRIDELPQLWCVLRGDMSWVGPRPERPEFVEVLARYIPNYQRRHAVLPGLTGWAQIRCGYCASVTEGYEKTSYDLYYVKRRSFWIDFLILTQTLRVPLFGDPT